MTDIYVSLSIWTLLMSKEPCPLKAKILNTTPLIFKVKILTMSYANCVMRVLCQYCKCFKKLEYNS